MREHIVSRDMSTELHASESPTAGELEALRRLIAVAMSDTGQSRKAASFLLAWWNAATCGGFDLTDLWAVDLQIRDDMLAVLGLVARVHAYPPTLDPGLRADFEKIIGTWRPHLLGK